MIDIDKLARGLAADLIQNALPNSPDVEDIVSDAFQRGLRLGLSLPPTRPLALRSFPSKTPEAAPCAPRH